MQLALQSCPCKLLAHVQDLLRELLFGIACFQQAPPMTPILDVTDTILKCSPQKLADQCKLLGAAGNPVDGSW